MVSVSISSQRKVFQTPSEEIYTKFYEYEAISAFVSNSSGVDLHDFAVDENVLILFVSNSNGEIYTSVTMSIVSKTGFSFKLQRREFTQSQKFYFSRL